MKYFLLCFIFFITFSTSPEAQNPHLIFNGQKLILYDSHNRLFQQWRAGAGRPFSIPEDQCKKNMGPLPEGDYLIRLDHTVFLKKRDGVKAKLSWIFRYIGWGDLAIPLQPNPENRMYGRCSFMIHGGGWVVGSKGCVYVYSKSEDVYQTLIKQSKSKTVWLTVDYL